MILDKKSSVRGINARKALILPKEFRGEPEEIPPPSARARARTFPGAFFILRK